MNKHFVVGMRILGIVLVAHAMMLIGADEISTIESGAGRKGCGVAVAALPAMIAPLSKFSRKPQHEHKSA